MHQKDWFFAHRPAGTSPPWADAARSELVSRKIPPLRALPPARSCHGGRARLLKVSRCGRGRAARSSHTRLQQPLRVCFRQRAQPGHPSTACREFYESARPPAASRPRTGSSTLRSGGLALAYPGPPRRPMAATCTRAVGMLAATDGSQRLISSSACTYRLYSTRSR